MTLSQLYWLIFIQLAFSSANYLEGVGYREEELQIPRGVNFRSEEPNGIPFSSFEGGTYIYIKGLGFDENPRNHKFAFVKDAGTLSEKTFYGEDLTENEAFNSDVPLGILAYHVPDLYFLTSMSHEDLKDIQTVEFSIIVEHKISGQTFSCKSGEEERCKIIYSKSLTPYLYGISPQVLYPGIEVKIQYNPKGVMSHIQDLKIDEKFFTNFKISNSQLYFEKHVNRDQEVREYEKQSMYATVGKVPTQANLEVSMLWETGFAHKSHQLQTCLVDMDCYETRTVPVIFSISADEGYMSGGQNFTIVGYGFKSQKDVPTVVHLDGEQCQITFVSNELIHCTTPKREIASQNGNFSGYHGIYKEMYVYDTLEDFELDEGEEELTLYIKKESSFLTNGYDHNELFGKVVYTTYQGQVVAPRNGSYYLNIECDHQCELTFLDTEIEYPPLGIESDSLNKGRKWWQKINEDGESVQGAGPINLEAGQVQKFTVRSLDPSGVGEFTLGLVAITNHGVKDHPQAMREVQVIEIVPADKQFEQYVFTISEPDFGFFAVSFEDPETGEIWTSKLLTVTPSAEEFKELIVGYFNREPRNSDIDVVLESNLDDLIFTYTVTLKRLIPNLSSQDVTISLFQSETTIDVVAPYTPDIGVASSEPLSGKFKIACGDENSHITDPISYDASALEIQDALFYECPELENMVEVYDSKYYRYPENGRQFLIYFHGMAKNMPQLSAVSDSEDELGGNAQLIDATLINYNPDILVYDPIPYEYVKTFHEKPQVQVIVDGVPAACSDPFGCGYMAIEIGDDYADSVVYTEESQMLSFDGPFFSTRNESEILEVLEGIKFAGVDCTFNSSDNTCTLVDLPQCGSYLPQILTFDHGPIFIDSAAIEISCNITDFSPKTLSPLGSQIVTITGTGFPYVLEGNDLDIQFLQTDSEKCIVQETQYSEIKCLTQPFPQKPSKKDIERRLDSVCDSGVCGVQVTVNLISAQLESEITLSEPYKVTAISQAIVTPVQRTNVELSIDSTFPHELNYQDFKVWIEDKSTQKTENLSVVGVDQDGGKIIVRYKNVKNGEYVIHVSHSQEGLLRLDIPYSGNSFTVTTEITSISTNEISINGGTYVLIEGGAFIPDDIAGQFTVTIEWDDVYNTETDCFYVSSTFNKYVCRTERYRGADDPFTTGKIIMRLNNTQYDKAVCQSTTCNVKLVNATAEIDNAYTYFNDETSEFFVNISGTDLIPSEGTNPENYIELIIDGIMQTVEQVDADGKYVLFKITEVNDYRLENIQLNLLEGTPNGMEIFNNITMRLPVKFKGATSSHITTGSKGGTNLIFTVLGVGVKNTGTMNFLDSSLAELCESVVIERYSEVQCMTKLGIDVNQTLQDLIVYADLSLSVQEYRNLDQEIFDAMNFVRTQPLEFVKLLEDMLLFFDGDVYKAEGYEPITTVEGPKAVQEAIDFLRQFDPIQPLELGEDMDFPCRDHVADIGPSGSTDSTGSDGSDFASRLERYGAVDKYKAESLLFGYTTGEQVVIKMIVDDGVASRENRDNVLNVNFNDTGIFSGYHDSLGHVTCIAFADNYTKDINESLIVLNETQYREMDELIVAKINEFRSDPTELIARLTEMKNHFQDLDFKDVNKVRFQTTEGVTAVDEAITYLEGLTTPLDNLTLTDGLVEACQNHTLDAKQNDIIGKISSLDLTPAAIVDEYGLSDNVEMSMQYGNITVIDIIAWLVIDDGNAGRENRLAMFNDSNAYFGVFSDEHPTEGHQNCILYADTYVDNIDPPLVELSSEEYEALSAAIVTEVNTLRQDPKSLVTVLEDMEQYFFGNDYKVPGYMRVTTNEGFAAVQELIDYLNTAPDPAATRRRLQDEWKTTLVLSEALTQEDGINQACKDLLDDTGRSDDDINSDGSTLEIRIDKYGLATGVAQNIAYGETDAQKLLIKMLVDDGFSGRERRYNILNPAYAYFGVYTTSDTTNSTNGHQHCMKFAETYVDNQYDQNLTLNSTEYTSIDDYLFAEINKIREDPTYIIPALEALEDNFSTINTLEYKTPGRFAILTTEGYAAVQEAIDELNSATALDPLTRQEGMNNACQDHVADATEITGNIGTDDSTPFDRIDKYGLATGEEQSMAYDRKDQLEILLQLIIGDGDSNRTNRGFILNPSLTQFGVYSGAHTLNGHQSCLVYAETYFDNVDDSTVTQTSDEYLTLDEQVFDLINQVRTDPTSIIEELELRKTYFKLVDEPLQYKAPGKVKELTVEGSDAYDELITFLNTSSAIDALTNQTGIVKACEIYVNDQGPLGGTSETDSEGRSAFDRVDINGLSTTVEQNNAYSKITAMDIVVQLLVGDGDDTRANRVALFNSNYSHVGVYTGSHSSEGHVTCINYADTYVDNVNDNEVALSETEYRTLDEEIIDAINTVRTDPASFATILTERLDYFDENGFYKSPGKFNFSTTDGKAAYEEAITFLGTFTAFTTNLTLEAGMNSACQDHVTDQNTNDITGNTDSNGKDPAFRVDVYGLATTVEQINDYGHITGLDVVIDMIVDDGDATKARRNLLLAATNNYLGVFSGEHVSEGHAICVTLAETYVDNIDNTTVPIDAAGYTTIDTALFDQQNAARQDPKSLVPILTEMLAYFDDSNGYKKPGFFLVETQEGAAAVQEAIDYLNTAPDVVPLRRLQEEWKTTLVLNDPLTSQNGMISACKDHVEDTGPLNITGNVGSEDKLTPEYRVDKYGLATGVSQSMTYGTVDGLEILLKMIIDDGNPERTNRYNVFNPDHVFFGQYSGSHDSEGHQTCTVYATTYIDNVDDSKTALTTAEYLTLDADILTQINAFRADPTLLKTELENLLPLFDESDLKYPGKFAIPTTEGNATVLEAIAAIDSYSTTTALTLQAGMSSACEDHVLDIQATSLIGNIGTDDSEPFDRVDVYGLATDVRQNNALGRITGLDVILQIVLDDGKDPRTGLNNILNETIAHIGIFSGVHDQEGHFSCVSLAATYIDNVNDDQVALTPEEYRALDTDIVTELINLRKNVTEIVDLMTTRLSYFDASNNYKQPGKFIRSTTEGATAYQEAIDFLNAFEELSVDLILEEGMSNSCKDHTDDTGNSQVIGNIGRDDSTPADRVDRYGLAEGVEQSMDYRSITAQDVLIDMLVGDGDATRAKRGVIMNSASLYFGVYSDSKNAQGHMSCIVFASSYVDNYNDKDLVLTEEQYRANDLEILDYINLARSQPTEIIPLLEDMKQYFNAKIYKFRGKFAQTTLDGVAAVESAITYLTELTPVSNLTYEVGMSNACKDHVLDLSPTSTTGNTGTDDSTPAQRVDKWGLATVVDQVNEYETATGIDTLLKLIIDDGTNKYTLREKLFKDTDVHIGIYSGNHTGRGHQYCITFAETYIDNLDDSQYNITEPEYRTLDQDLLAKINEFRADPSLLQTILETNITYFVDDTNNYKVPGQFEITTAGGSAAVQAAIDYIAAITTPLSPYTFEDGLESACKDHVDDLETTEIEGNTGQDGSTPEYRVDQHGLATGVQQNMGYARIRAEDIIVQMILDDDNATTPMIANLLSSTITQAGIFSGPHAGRGHQSCVVMTETYVDNVNDFSVELTNQEYATLDEGILTELNSARTDFTTLISDLEALEPFYDNSTKIFKRPGKFALSTDEGYTAVLDAISYLQGFTAEDQALILSFNETTSGMNSACQDQVTSGNYSQPFNNVDKYGLAENVFGVQMYGWITPQDVILNLAINDGDSTKIFRETIFDDQHNYVGIYSGPDSSLGHVSCIVFASSYIDNFEDSQTVITEPEYRTLDDDLISKINEFRADPSKLKAILEQNLTYFLDDGFNYKVPGQFEITTLGGIDAVNAAITQIELFIDLAVPAGNLTFEEGLETACKDHVDDTAATEVIGNTGADSSSPADRVDRHGLATGVQQIMSYGRIRAEDAIVKMIFDDDTAQAKLLTLLGTDLMYFGAFSGTHSGKGHQSCVVFAETYVDNVDDSKVTQTIQEYQDLDLDIGNEINSIRSDPASFLTILNERLTYFVDDFNYKEPGKFELTTLGGKAALEGAIASLEALISAETVLSNYTFEDGLESACIDHVTDLAGSQITGSTGTDGTTIPADRVDVYGLATGVAQNNAYGRIDAEHVIIQMILDDTSGTSAEFSNLFSSEIQYFGAFSGNHSGKSHQTCVAFAETYVDNVDDSQIVLDQAAYTQLDSDIFDTINSIRTDPRSILPDLEEMKTYFDSTGLIFKAPGKFPITTTEGLAALEEAIAYIETVPAPTRLRRLQDEWRTNLIASDNQTIAEGMVQACEDHVNDTGLPGLIGNIGSDDSTPTIRLERYGISSGQIEQNMGYSFITSMDVVLWMIIDDGNAERTNRFNIFNPAHLVQGTYSGTHSSKGHQTCTMFGLDYSPDVDDTLLVLDIEDYAALDEQIFNEINSIRADASGYIALLNSIKGNFDGNTYKERGKVSYETEEGVTAVDEAIAYLTGLTAMDPLFREEGMNFACKDHVEDTGLSGTFGNTGTDDSTVEDRVDKYGLALNPSQSNAYGKVTAQDVLLRMIIDDGNAERSNRLNIFISTNNNTGIHSGIHNVTGHMSCVTFAEKYDDNVDDSQVILEEPEYRALDEELLVEINKLREDPKSLIPALTTYRNYFYELTFKRPGHINETTIEGVAAVDDAITYLTSAPAVANVSRIGLIDDACKDHVDDTGPGGEIGNTGADGSSPLDRLQRYGTTTGIIEQSNGYGLIEAIDIILQMVIDDGNLDRQNRNNLLNGDLTVAGLFSGTHNTRGHQYCVKLVTDFTPDADDTQISLTEPEYRTLDEAIFAELNIVRQNPTSYATILTDFKQNFDSTGLIYKELGKVSITYTEGQTAFEEAITFLEGARAVPALTIESDISLACSDHVDDTKTPGTIGNTGADDSSPLDRLQRYGTTTGAIEQNMGYGRIEAIYVITQMLVGDGDNTRQQRLNIFNANFTLIGLYSGEHSVNGHQTCLKFVENFTPDVDDTQLELNSTQYETIDAELFDAINDIRANPLSFIPYLESIKSNFNGLNYKELGFVARSTEEGVTAVDDAISYLTTATPTTRLRRLQDEWKTTLTASDPLALENGMVEACKDFVTTTKDITGTTGTDGSSPFERVDKYGLATGTLQSTGYGRVTAQELLAQLIIDDGVQNRDNRFNIFDPDHAFTGIFSGTHNSEGHQICIVYAITYVDNVFDKDVEVSNYTTIDEDIFTELNELRTNPRSFIPILEDLKQYFDTTGFIFKFPGKFAKTTTDGVAAIDEAIAYLETVPEATRLRRLQDEWKTNLIVTDAMDNPESLILACEDYVKDVGPTGVTTKTGVDGSSIQDRIERHGIWTSTFAQSNTFGRITGRDIILSLLIDDGVVTKENRYNLLNPAHLFTGPYSGTHFTEGHLSCMVFVGGWTPNVDDKTTVLDDAAYRAIDDEFFTELNKVRLDPTSLVADLEAMLPRFTETSYKDYGKFAISTTEGADAVNDAIAFLQSASPTQALTLYEGMEFACRDHVDDTAPTGVIGNNGTDGSEPIDRIKRYGLVDTYVDQNMQYTKVTGKEVLMWMIIGDGDALRTSRTNLFKDTTTAVGAYSGPHEGQGHQTCVKLADVFTPDVDDKEVTLVDADYRAIDVSIFETLNSIRENPRSFVPFLTSMKDYFDSSGLIYKEDGRVPIQYTEGVTAIDEAIAYLETAPVVTRLRRLQESWQETLVISEIFTEPEGMVFACKDHVLDTSATELIGNTGTDGSSPADRVDKYGLATGVE